MRLHIAEAQAVLEKGYTRKDCENRVCRQGAVACKAAYAVQPGRHA